MKCFHHLEEREVKREDENEGNVVCSEKREERECKEEEMGDREVVG